MFGPGSNPSQQQPPVGVDRFAPPPRRVAEVVLVGGAAADLLSSAPSDLVAPLQERKTPCITTGPGHALAVSGTFGASSRSIVSTRHSLAA